VKTNYRLEQLSPIKYGLREVSIVSRASLAKALLENEIKNIK
jgi:hypothetical protein